MDFKQKQPHLFGLFLILFFSVAVLSSCNKENQQNKIQPNQSVQDQTTQFLSSKDMIYIYKLDNVIVSESDFTIGDPSLLIWFHQTSANVLVVNAFTSEDKMIEYGYINQIDIRTGLEIEKELASLAVSSGAMAEEERTGQIPSWWNQLVEDHL